MATHYDITMGNNVSRDNDVTMGTCNNIAMCTYQSITVHNGIAMNLFCYVLSSLCLIVLFIMGSME